MHSIEMWGMAGIIFLSTVVLSILFLLLRELRLQSILRRGDSENSPTRLTGSEATPYFLENHTESFACPKSFDFHVRLHPTNEMGNDELDYIAMYSPVVKVEYVDSDSGPALFEEPDVNDYVPASSIYI